MSDIVRIEPEDYEVANSFLIYGSIDETAIQLAIPRHEVTKILGTPEVRRYLDQVYLDRGYRNRDKLGKLLDEMIDSKLEEARETGIYTSKDLLEIIQLVHKMRMDEIKNNPIPNPTANVPGVAVQVNNQFGDSNYGRLMEKLLNE